MNLIKQLTRNIQEGNPVQEDLDLSNAEFNFQTNSLSFNSFIDFLNSNSQALKNVRRLSLRSNHLQEIPAFVFQLKNLRELSLDKNDIRQIPAAIQSLEELVVLNISENHLEELPDEIVELRCLKELRVNGNSIRRLPEKIYKLTNLEQLIAHGNKINHLSENIVKIKRLDWLQINDNPVENVSGAIYTQGNGIDALRIYFRSLEEGSGDFFEGKIIILGDGQVGKSTIVKNLKEICCLSQHHSTVGLEVSDWSLVLPERQRIFKFNVWDFGGQGKYRTVQQLFCTPNAVYIYVTVPGDIRQPEKYGNYQYWLNFINVLGDNSPVIFVVNKADKVSPEKVFTDQAAIHRAFPFIKRFVTTSFNRWGSSRVSVENLKTALEQCIPSGANNSEGPVLRIEELSKKWLCVIARVNKLRAKYQYISKQYFIKICKKEQIEDIKEINVLLEFLNKTGALLRYPGTSSRSFEFQIILDPNWIKECAYKVIEYLEGAKKYWFIKDELELIWADFPEREEYYTKILDLMVDLNFSFRIEQTWYVPSLLPSFEGETEQEFVACMYTYECIFKPYIPPGLLHKIIAKNIQSIKIEEFLWENRIIFLWKKYNSRVEVLEEWSTGKLTFNFTVKSFKMVWHLTEEIEQATKDFEGRSYNNELTKEEYIIFEGRKIELDSLPEIWFSDIPVFNSGHASTHPQAETRQSDSRKKLVFISYNHLDIAMALRIRDCLQANDIDVTLDEDAIKVGEDIMEFIRQSIRKADAVISVVSANSLKSGWVGQESVAAMYAVWLADNKKFLPVRLDQAALDMNFQIETLEYLKEKEEETQNQIQQITGLGGSPRASFDALNRIHDLRNSLGTIFQRLNSINAPHINDANFNLTMKKIMESIKSPVDRP